ncbi:hypothetical protein [Actinomadura sp. 3N407]|uniref:hypothetical protein n=1 Tax=Actinomadura sp. 3N407 TaxID=3457423 RepID=UPI003FCC5415
MVIPVVRAPRRTENGEAMAAAGPRAPLAPDLGWPAAEEIAESLRSRIPEVWMEALTAYTAGDEAMARRVYDVLSGVHLLGELWRDEHIDEVHIQGTEVTVCGTDGVYPVAGFPSLAAAERAVEAFTASRDRAEAIVSRIGDAVVVSRRAGTGPDVTRLLVGGIITEEQLSQITLELQYLRAVTVTGPAARILVRALSSLVPAGSRVFLGSYATLPAGCVAAAEPLEADYVIGVRPGVVAEEMAEEGQVGALIANPETRIRAALRFAVPGPSMAPGRVSQIP